MTSFIEEPTATVAEIAKRIGKTAEEVEAEASDLQIFIGENWAQQPAMSAKDAYTLVTGSARADRDQQRAWQAHLAALEEWQNERERVRRQVFNDAWKVGVKAGHGNYPSTEKAHQAAGEAVADFERRNPEPVFGESKRCLFGRVKAGAR
jgi:hypothetical protein